MQTDSNFNFITRCSAHYYLRPVDENSAVEPTEDTSPNISTKYGFKDVSSTGLIVHSTEVGLHVVNNDELNDLTTDAVNESRERVEDQEHLVLETGENVNDSSHVPALTKEGILQRLALLYSKKGLSLSALGGVAKLVKDLGHDIPTDQRTILKTTRVKVGDKKIEKGNERPMKDVSASVFNTEDYSTLRLKGVFLQEAYAIKFHQYLQINRTCAFFKHMGNQQIAAFFEVLGYAIRERACRSFTSSVFIRRGYLSTEDFIDSVQCFIFYAFNERYMRGKKYYVKVQEQYILKPDDVQLSLFRANKIYVSLKMDGSNNMGS
ncbi:hypothetical protein OUZ56_003435 [Daphnia magna]|uniref:Cc8L18.2-like protein n=1 Tax=Daphnia magna TaxID=35525 RepID=A0ABR0A950_9CRUS|nr:hypothetical protein OUZ56_003435 [Daphnia magna]